MQWRGILLPNPKPTPRSLWMINGRNISQHLTMLCHFLKFSPPRCNYHLPQSLTPTSSPARAVKSDFWGADLFWLCLLPLVYAMHEKPRVLFVDVLIENILILIPTNILWLKEHNKVSIRHSMRKASILTGIGWDLNTRPWNTAKIALH